MPLGDSALLVRFGEALDEAANRAAIGFARRLVAEGLPDVLEVVPNLVSVLIRFDPLKADAERLAGDLRLVVSVLDDDAAKPAARHVVPVSFGGEDSDLDEVAAALGLTPKAFIAAHNKQPLRVLAIGFAPGFAYCGFHPETLRLPRRTVLRQKVPPGTVLFAAGQTAIAATEIPTGWHVIGHTSLSNFDPAADPPVRLQPGDEVRFEVAK
jgi:KipI family sensor histidine kinase inhibitor